MRRLPVSLSSCAFAMALSVSSAFAAIHVAADGSGDYPTIQAAIVAAADGDSIFLGDGTYRGAGNRQLEISGKALSILSQSDDPTTCVFDGEDQWRFLTTDGPSTHLQGIGFRNGYFLDEDVLDGGGALSYRGGVHTVVGCEFIDNYCTENGGAIYILEQAGGVVDVSFCTFSGNEASSGSAYFSQYMRGSVDGCRFENNIGGVIAHLGSSGSRNGSIRRCTFANNTGIAAFVGGGEVRVEECVFVGNQSAQWTLGLAGGSEPPVAVRDCTFVQNSAERGIISMSYLANPTLERILIAFNDAYAVRYAPNEPEPAILHCSDLHGNTDGDWTGPAADQLGQFGNFSADPIFCAPDDGIFTLDASSPCLPQNHPDGAWTCDGIVGAEPVGCPTTGLDQTPRLESPSAFSLGGPNPTRLPIRYSIQNDGSITDVELQLFDAAGRLHATLWRGACNPGELEGTWAPEKEQSLPTGIYYLELRRSGNVAASRKVVVLSR